MSRHVGRDRADSSIWLPDSVTRRGLIRTAVGATLGGSALLNAACGSTGTSTNPTSGPVKRGGTLRLAITDAVSSEKLDPALSFAGNDIIYLGLIFESLTTTDTQWNLKPALATAWKANDEATEWTFTLRPGVKFHDGSPFTSKDVVFSLKRMLDKDLGSPMYGRLHPSLASDGISAPNDMTVVLRLKRPDSLIPVALAQRNAKIVKAGTTKFTTATAVGTGPFMLTAWTPGRSWVVKRNPAYWQKGLPYLDAVNAVVVADQSTKLQSVVSGQNDVTDAIDLSLVASVQGNPRVSTLKIDNRQSWLFSMDHRVKPFDDPRVVEAIKIGQDRKKFLDAVLQGHGNITADVPVAPGSSFYPQGLNTAPQIERARSLLAEAGHPNGLDIELNTSAVAAGMVDMATVFQQVMKPIGVRVKLKQWPTSAYWNKVWMQKPMFQDYLNTRHPADMLSVFYASDAPWNESQYKDPALDKKIAAVFGTTDPDQQASPIQDAFSYASTHTPYAFPALASQVYVQKKGVRGLTVTTPTTSR